MRVTTAKLPLMRAGVLHQVLKCCRLRVPVQHVERVGFIVMQRYVIARMVKLACSKKRAAFESNVKSELVKV